MNPTLRTNILLFLQAVMLAVFAVAFALAGDLGFNAHTFMLALVALIYFVAVVIPGEPPDNKWRLNRYTVSGLIAGALLVIFFPVLSPALLEPVALLLLLFVIWIARLTL